MPINVSCQCGKSFQVKDELAGQSFRCPACTNPLQIPTPRQSMGAVDDLLSEAGMVGSVSPKCPACDADIAQNAVLCINCGYNLETGAKIRTMSETGHAIGASETDKLLAKAAVELEKEPIKQDQGYGSASEAWLMFGIMVVGGGIALGGFFAIFKWVDSQNNAPAIMLGLGYVMYMVGLIWTLIIAFKETVLQGVLCLFIPLYIFLYMIVNMDECFVPGILAITGFLMIIVSSIMQAVSAEQSSMVINWMTAFV